jgi:hypothetical protein
VIATKDFAAARTLTAQLLRILVEKNMGVACHSTPLMLGLSEFLERMLPQSEKGVFVVIIVDRFWLWRVEMT